MLYNYHTHTTRCRHAKDSERQYIETAIKAGTKVLGFSDHVPVAGFPEGYYSGFRMTPEELPDYVGTLQALKKEYEDQIKILIGFEMEYYPAYFEETLRLLSPYDYDYLILGQHQLHREWDDLEPVSAMAPTPHRLTQYVEQVVEGMKTGVFSYLAHPDMLCFEEGDEDGRRLMEKICITANEMNMSLEYNLLGVRARRRYPTERFFRLAAEHNCSIILGCDAHSAKPLFDPKTEQEAYEFLARCGVTNITDQIRLRK